MRQIINLNSTWKFTKDAPEVENRQFEEINLPHSWNAIDGQDGGNDYFRGTAYYEKKLVKADFPEADRYYL